MKQTSLNNSTESEPQQHDEDECVAVHQYKYE